MQNMRMNVQALALFESVPSGANVSETSMLKLPPSSAINTAPRVVERDGSSCGKSRKPLDVGLNDSPICAAHAVINISVYQT